MRKLWVSGLLIFLTPLLCQAQTQEIILPVVVNGFWKEPAHFQTTIRIVNLSTQAVEVTLEAYQNDGTATRILELYPIAKSGTKTVFQIMPGGSVEAFTTGDEPAFDGWARLSYETSASIQASAEIALVDAPVGPKPICQRPSTEIVTSAHAAGVPESKKYSGFIVIRPFRKSAYALVNPSTTSTANVFLSLLDFSGKLVASAGLQIPPQGRSRGLLPDLLDNPPEDFIGSLRITSDIPIGVGALNVLFPEGKFTSVLVTATEVESCIQVITLAKNPLTGECRSFPTPCDVPDGWEKVFSCN
ncbi:hypothetical protein MYX82_06245 [Acidobacteria bacterium AH-259-D05]|nr:hypothetical protein [Acidobacteria bacterium AH-259-D05]